MSEFAPRWTYWPEVSTARLLGARGEKKTAETRTQRTDKTDKSLFDGFVGSLTGHGGAFAEASSYRGRCLECWQRKAEGVAILACGVCGFKAERTNLGRKIGRRTYRGEYSLAGGGVRLRLIAGAGGEG